MFVDNCICWFAWFFWFDASLRAWCIVGKKVTHGWNGFIEKKNTKRNHCGGSLALLTSVPPRDCSHVLVIILLSLLDPIHPSIHACMDERFRGNPHR
jgi:hypothetical protein